MPKELAQPITSSLPPDLVELAKEHANESPLFYGNVSAVIRTALAEYLDYSVLPNKKTKK